MYVQIVPIVRVLIVTLSLVELLNARRATNYDIANYFYAIELVVDAFIFLSKSTVDQSSGET